jgi:hypothetical protein
MQSRPPYEPGGVPARDDERQHSVGHLHFDESSILAVLFFLQRLPSPPRGSEMPARSGFGPETPVVSR